VGVDAPVSDPAIKREWHSSSDAVAVDMESHIAARLAAAHALAFAAARVIVDPAHRAVPAAALAGVRPDGSTDAAAVLRALMATPSEAFGLIRLAADACLARNALQRGRRMFGPRFGLAETGQADTSSAAAAAASRKDPEGMTGIADGIPNLLTAEESLA
jgi:hypothetical protein